MRALRAIHGKKKNEWKREGKKWIVMYLSLDFHPTIDMSDGVQNKKCHVSGEEDSVEWRNFGERNNCLYRNQNE